MLTLIERLTLRHLDTARIGLVASAVLFPTIIDGNAAEILRRGKWTGTGTRTRTRTRTRTGEPAAVTRIVH